MFIIAAILMYGRIVSVLFIGALSNFLSLEFDRFQGINMRIAERVHV